MLRLLVLVLQLAKIFSAYVSRKQLVDAEERGLDVGLAKEFLLLRETQDAMVQNARNVSTLDRVRPKPSEDPDNRLTTPDGKSRRDTPAP